MSVLPRTETTVLVDPSMTFLENANSFSSIRFCPVETRITDNLKKECFEY